MAARNCCAQRHQLTAQMVRSQIHESPDFQGFFVVGTAGAYGELSPVPRVAALCIFESNRQQKKLMKKLNRWFLMAGVAWMAGLGASNALAEQDRPQRGNFDPAEFQQRRMDALKEQMEAKDDSEWNAIKPLVQKVMDAQRAVFADRMRGAMRGMRPGGPGGFGGGGAGAGAAADQGG